MEKIHKVREKEGCLFPNEIKGWFFPNWFNKEHFETFLDRKLTDFEFDVLKEELEESNICDSVSSEIREFLNTYGIEILEEIKYRKLTKEGC